MIKIYENGNALIDENRDFLNTNPELSCFFFLDAPELTCCDKINYAIMAHGDGGKLLALKVEPYSMLLFGDDEYAEELIDYLKSNGYEMKNMLGDEALCEKITSLLDKKYGTPYYEALAMDFMSVEEKTEPSSDEVEAASESDLDEIVSCLEKFIIDCGLTDKVNVEKTRKGISSYRVIRKDGVIVSMANFRRKSTDTSMRIGAVYTRPEYRGMGYAKKVVNNIKNEILDAGYIATLNVDKKNPVSNKLYASLGFKKVFSQGDFRPVSVEEKADEAQAENSGSGIAMGMLFGMAIGTAIGSLKGNVGIWMSMGISFGMALGAVFDSVRKSKK